MNIIYAQSVSEALAECLYKMKMAEPADSRVGSVYVLSDPVITTYTKPHRRVLYSPARDANPFFHLMEALWMLAGRNDVAFPSRFAKQIAQYSDNGKIMWGAYGWRWREFFGYDQLNAIADELKKNPTSRRAVLSMWNGMRVDESYSETYGERVSDEIPSDLGVAYNGGKDVPCNTHAYFDLRGGVLNMTVCNRSNDAIWGAYGANAVHFSVLLEYMAAKIGVPVGVYRQFSNNMHVYTEVLDTMAKRLRRSNVSKLSNVEALGVDYPTLMHMLASEVESTDVYTDEIDAALVPVVTAETLNGFEVDLRRFLSAWKGPFNELNRYETPFFNDVVWPMYIAWDAYSHKAEEWGDVSAFHEAAYIEAYRIKSPDWRIAVVAWLDRRFAEREQRTRGDLK